MHQKYREGTFLLAICMLVAAGFERCSFAEDWPQWLGVRRDSEWRESGLLQSFPESGPPVVWRCKIGYGYAGPAVAGGRVFVPDFLTEKIPVPSAGRRDKLQGVERLLCLEADTGKLIWKHEHRCTYNISFAYGPRATPTVDEDRVYTLGAEGNLCCLRVEDGTEVWSKQLTEIYGVETPLWGFAGHPLIDGNRLICIVGGKGSVAVAFDKRTGEEQWRALSAKEPGYCAPTLIHAGGKPQLLIWHPESLNSLDPETGDVYWTEPFKPDYGMSIAVPRFDDPFLFVGGYQGKSMLLKLDTGRPAAEFVWAGRKGRGIAPVLNSPITDDGYLYGVDRNGDLRCVEMESGEQLWTDYQATDGDRPLDNASAFLVKNGDRYFIFNDIGELIIAQLSPEGYQERSRTQIIKPLSQAYGRNVVWSHPAFAQKCIFARNDREIVCYSLAK